MNKNNGYRKIFENFWEKVGREILEKYGERDINIYYIADDTIGSTCAGYLGAVLNEVMQKQGVGYKAAIDRIRDEDEFGREGIIEEMTSHDNIILGSSIDNSKIKKIAEMIAKAYEGFAYSRNIPTKGMRQLFEEPETSKECEIPNLLYGALVDGDIIDILPIVNKLISED